MKGIIWSPKTLYWACTIICMPKMNIMMPLTCDTTASPSEKPFGPRRDTSRMEGSDWTPRARLDRHHHVVLATKAHLVERSYRFVDALVQTVFQSFPPGLSLQKSIPRIDEVIINLPAVEQLEDRQREDLCRTMPSRKLSRRSHEARGLSGGRIDLVAAVWHRLDAIAATTSSSSSFSALSH